MAKAVLVAAIPPLMLKNDDDPEGTPMEVFDGFRTALAGNRAQFFRDVPSGPFSGFNREGAAAHEGVLQNWWRQGMMGKRQGALRWSQGLLGNRPRPMTSRRTPCQRRCCTVRTTRSFRSPPRL
ncbi:non-heme chloroperoxidase [Sinorhizobium meliloti]|nr:non-heme chloroperoxidase [Sinorhizobium meliloti]